MLLGFATVVLKYRVITSLVLAGLFLISIFFLPSAVLKVIFLLIIASACQEWARLIGYSKPTSVFAYVIFVLSSILVIYHFVLFADIKSVALIQPLLVISVFFWALAFLWVKGYPESAKTWNSVAIKSCMGGFLLVPLWFSASFIFNLQDGRYILTAFVLLVAGADVGAYLVGKKIGRRPLILSVSPNKTWEGFYGGVIFSSLLAVFAWFFVPLYYSYLHFSVILMITIITVLASVVGDLTVSMLKRETGLKDTGSLLPGHGGLLDRMDSFCSAAPAFTLGVIAIQ